MIKTVLSLDVSDNSNLKVIRLFDTSHYVEGEVIDNYLIEVLPPLKSTWMAFTVFKNFSLALNSSSLHYRKVTDTSTLMELPDGIFEFKQSFKPNIITLIHFYHLRTTELKGKLSQQWHKLNSVQCKITREEFSVNRDKLREIDEYITAAKYETEECLDKEKGKELYDFASKLLDHYTNDCKC